MQERISSPVIVAPGAPKEWVAGEPMIQTRQPLLNPEERAALYAQYEIDARMAAEKKAIRELAQMRSAQEQAYMSNMMSVPQTVQRIPQG